MTTAALSTSTRVIAALAGIGTIAMGGVFFAFSTFVMQGLRRLPPAQGLHAMQSINVTAVRPPFMGLMFGTAALCVYLGVRSVLAWTGSTSGLLVVGCAVYLVCVVLLTIVCHVPMNEGLASLDPHGDGSAGRWESYAGAWTAWNHLRTAGGVGAGALIVAALLR